MTRPLRAGVRVTLGNGPPLGGSFAIVRTQSGEETLWPESADETSQFELRLFVELDGGQRVGSDEQSDPDVELSLAFVHPSGSSMDRSEFERVVRETVFDEDLREIEEELHAGDPDLRIGPDWDRLVRALRRVGVEASAAELETLPFVVECDDEVLALVSG